MFQTRAEQSSAQQQAKSLSLKNLNSEIGQSSSHPHTPMKKKSTSGTFDRFNPMCDVTHLSLSFSEIETHTQDTNDAEGIQNITGTWNRLSG